VSRRGRAGAARAQAGANIALAKYWGKSDAALNLPAVPSISLTLDRLVTRTSVELDGSLDGDRLVLDGAEASGRALARVVEVLDRVRAEAGIDDRAHVRTENAFPTAAGLASSASGFAALAAAARLARRASASAARSVFGGWVELPAGRPGDGSLAARELHPADHWDVRLVIALAATGPKDVPSTEGMERSRRTSPYHDAWIGEAPRLARRLKRGLSDRDLHEVGAAMERSTLAFHAAAMTSDPPILYWRAPTVGLLERVRRLREERDVGVWATMDAGPHVKALCHARDAKRVQRALRDVPGVEGTLIAAPGGGVRAWSP